MKKSKGYSGSSPGKQSEELHLIAITTAVLSAPAHGQFSSWAEEENKNQTNVCKRKGILGQSD